MAQHEGNRRFTADDWAHAALRVVGEQGLAGVAVEPLAVRLGTTKGSFYWHFRNRDALIEAALELWERVHTEEIIESIDAATETGPRARLRALFASIDRLGGDRGRTGAIEVNLMAAADHPAVAPVLHRVVDRRLAYLRDIFAELGLDPAEATQRALIAYTGYIGTAQLGHRMPAVLPANDDARSSYLDSLLALLLAGTGEARLLTVMPGCDPGQVTM